MTLDITPGVIHPGEGWDDGPVAIVTREPARAREYLEKAPIGPYVVVHELAHLPADVELGGVALLDAEPLPDGLPEALAEACGLTTN